MTGVMTEFFASNLGGDEFRVLARFTTDEHGLHMERFDRQDGRWIPDISVAGFYTGHDDWAQRVTEADARRLVEMWGVDPSLLAAPVTEAATT